METETVQCPKPFLKPRYAFPTVGPKNHWASVKILSSPVTSSERGVFSTSSRQRASNSLKPLPGSTFQGPCGSPMGSFRHRSSPAWRSGVRGRADVAAVFACNDSTVSRRLDQGLIALRKKVEAFQKRKSDSSAIEWPDLLTICQSPPDFIYEN